MNARNMNGGLTLVPLPGLEAFAGRIKTLIEGKERNEKETPVDIAIPDIGFRSNEEPAARLADKHINGHDCIVLACGPGTPTMIVNLLLTLAYVRGRHARRISVIFGYFPWGRTDKDEAETEFALPWLLIKLMETCLNGQTLHRIVVFDPHSLQLVMSAGPGIITPVTVVQRLLTPAIADAKQVGFQRICLLLPDDGADKRFRSYIAQVCKTADVNFPIFVAWKRRIDSYHSVFGGIVPNERDDLAKLEGALVLSVDDEIATGGTNINPAHVLKSKYKTRAVWALSPHGVLCSPAAINFMAENCPVDRVYVANTILSVETRKDLQLLKDQGVLVVVSCDRDFANIIFHLHWDLSVRGLR